MKLYIDIAGDVKLEIDRNEVRRAGLKATLDKWITGELDATVKEISDEKALEYLNAIGDVSGVPIRDLVEPSKVITLEEPEYLDNDENPYPEDGELGQWTCTVCGSPNTVSVDDGCTNCDH